MSPSLTERRVPWLLAGLLVVTFQAGGCDSGPADRDGGADAAVADGAGDSEAPGDGDARSDGAEADADEEAGSDGGTPVSGEDVALVATSVTFTAERVCDLDGDGVGDNAIAELGEPGSESAAMLWNALSEAALREGYGPGLFFRELVDGGESLLVAPSGDGAALSGELRASYDSMDGCGEPRFVYRDELVSAGGLSLSASEYPLLVSDVVASGRALVSGELVDGAGGMSLETEECVAVSITSLGAAYGPSQTRGLSLLEVVLAGGAALGMGGAPGLSPDVDVDGDGLERVLLGSDGRVESCVDGDSAVVAGRDCWADDRMADAFALTRRVRYEETTFAGRVGGWLGYCTEAYPRPSLFGEEHNVTTDGQVTLGNSHTCFLHPDGAVSCWGQGLSGRLGYGNIDSIGDDEPACEAGLVDVGEGVLRLMAGEDHTCAVLAGRRLKCWGYVGLEPYVGDDEPPADGGDLELGAPVEQIVAGWTHFCALLSGGRVRCWGSASYGGLGLPGTTNLPIETAGLAPDVDVGGRVTTLASGWHHTCALLETGAVRCWGRGDRGELGYGNTDDVGDDETPAAAGDVPLGGVAVAIGAGEMNTCALLETGAVRCWGDGFDGKPGYGNTEAIGDDETPADAGDVNLGGLATAIAVGRGHTCALLEGGSLRCWGRNDYYPVPFSGAGRLGYGNPATIGDDEDPADAGDVPVGGPVAQVAAGWDHTCALLETGAVRCWGSGESGRLGYGNTEHVGDDETPASVGDVPVTCGP